MTDKLWRWVERELRGSRTVGATEGGGTGQKTKEGERKAEGRKT